MGHAVVSEQLLWGSAAHHAASLCHLARSDDAGGEGAEASAWAIRGGAGGAGGADGAGDASRCAFDVIVAADVVAVPYEGEFFYVPLHFTRILLTI